MHRRNFGHSPFCSAGCRGRGGCKSSGSAPYVPAAVGTAGHGAPIEGTSLQHLSSTRCWPLWKSLSWREASAADAHLTPKFQICVPKVTWENRSLVNAGKLCWVQWHCAINLHGEETSTPYSHRWTDGHSASIAAQLVA